MNGGSLSTFTDHGCRKIPSRALAYWVVIAFTLLGVPERSGAQSNPSERTYSQPKTAVQRALKELQVALSGHLPALEGFATAGEHPLNQYRRGFFQSTVQLTSSASGGTTVRVTTKITAWLADASTSRSGYQLIASNGRLESDLLDQLSDLLGSSPPNANNVAGPGSEDPSLIKSPSATSEPPQPSRKEKIASQKESGETAISASTPRLPEKAHTFPSMHGLSGEQLAATKTSSKAGDQPATGLRAETASLEEVLKIQAHPKNLVAIKKTGTPVVATPSLSGKTLFLATAHDEFEMLDFNADWVHVRISGISRGWIWRTGLEMPEGISDVPANAPSGAPIAVDLFQVSREETAPFPGDWEPLRGKSVRIISVQKIQENEKGSGAQAKLEFAKSLLDKNYASLANESAALAGVVLIFDSVDGGMIAATLPTVQQWKAGNLSDAALWHACYFDPPEMFSVNGAAGAQ